jgi:hypothetical protein
MMNLKGYSYKSTKIVYKKDIVRLCELLGELDYFKDICRFAPEPVYGGGIKFVYKENGKMFKTVRLGIRHFPYMDENVMDKWKNSEDIVLDKFNRINTILKSYDGSPVFNNKEVIFFENCLKELGFIRL